MRMDAPLIFSGAFASETSHFSRVVQGLFEKRVRLAHGCNQEVTTKSRPNEDGLFKKRNRGFVQKTGTTPPL